MIRGSPTEVLRALMDPHSATTILGPALEVEVLDSSPGRQVSCAQAFGSAAGLQLLVVSAVSALAGISIGCWSSALFLHG